MCVGCICRHAVLVKLAFDVLHHPLRFCCRLLQSSCPQYHGGCLLVLHLSCPCGFSLCVSSLCSTPAQVVRSLQSPLTMIDCLWCCPFCSFFFFFLLLLARLKIKQVHYESGQNNFQTLHFFSKNSWHAFLFLYVIFSLQLL